MSKADGNCNRCRGTGFRDTPVAHLGVPGLCFACDGVGTYEAMAIKNEASRKAKKIDKAFLEAYQMVNGIAEKNGGFKTLPRDRRKVLRSLVSPFSTQQYAEAVGITAREAWIELCCTSRGVVCPSIGEDLKASGWTTS